MTLLLTIIIASILCGVLFAAMWASANSLCEQPENVTIKVLITAKSKRKDAVRDIETAVIGVLCQLDRINVDPEIYISIAELDDEGKKEAKYVAAEYDAIIVTGDGEWSKQDI